MPRRPTCQLESAQQTNVSIASTDILIYTAFTAKALRKALAEQVDLSTAQFSLLVSLTRNGGGQRVGAIAQGLAVSNSAVSAAARDLEKRRLIRYQTLLIDRRAQELIITSAGKAAVACADTVVLKVISEVWQPLSAEQSKTMMQCALMATGNSGRVRSEAGYLRADTAYAEGMLMAHNAFTAVAHLHRLSYFEVTTLAWLLEHGGKRSKSALAESLLLKPNRFSQISESLLKRNLISEAASSGDRRLALVELTRAGRERCRRIQTSLDKVVTSDFYHSKSHEQQTFREVAKLIVNNEIRHRRHSL